MGKQNLLDRLTETFLWEVISAHVEQTCLLTDMLQDIGYLENKDEIIKKVDSLEILDSEPLEIFNCSADNGRISFGFQMPFVLVAKSGKEQLLRITVAAAGKCSIPDENSFDWNAFDWENMRKPELLAKKDLAEFSGLRFENAECDDLSVV